MKLLINPDQRKPLKISQIIEFLQELDPDEEIYILHVEEQKDVNEPIIAAPLTEILLPDGATSPEFISLYARDRMIQHYTKDK